MRNLGSGIGSPPRHFRRGRLWRYAQRIREAGVGVSAHILTARVAGYLRWPEVWWSRFRGGVKVPIGLPVGRTRQGEPRYILLGGCWEPVGAVDGPAREVPLTAAVAYLEQGFSPLGWGVVPMRPPVPWQVDGTTGTAWPLRFHKRIDYVRAGEPCDVKFPWELSRLQVLPVWAQAWRLSRDPRWFEACWELLRDWVDQNPTGYGVNWTCGMEVAIRSINLLGMAELLEPDLTDDQDACLRRLFRDHLSHLRLNLELSDVGGNHLWFDRVGIALLTRTLEGGGSKPFLNAATLLVTEAEAQFHEDGLHLEHASDYHRLVVDGLLLVLQATRLSHFPGRERLEAVARRACSALRALSLPDGTMPSIGDSDTGRVLLLGARQGNHAGASLALAESLGLVQGHSGSSWDPSLGPWFGLSPVHPAAGVGGGWPAPEIQAFPSGGLFVVSGHDLHVVMRAGPPGLRGRGSHDHNDQLSLWLAVQGHPVFIDPGTRTYTGSDALHTADLATRRHNTLVVSGMEQSPILPGSVSMTVRSVEGRSDGFTREADGFLRWQGQVPYGGPQTGLVHDRRVDILTGSPGAWRLRVEDRLQGEGAPGREAAVSWMLAPALRAEQESPTKVRILLPGGGMVHMVGSGPFESSEEWVSPRYGEAVPTRRWSMALDGGQAGSVELSFEPGPGGLRA